jgi:PAS domain S-box-containing protein
LATIDPAQTERRPLDLLARIIAIANHSRSLNGAVRTVLSEVCTLTAWPACCAHIPAHGPLHEIELSHLNDADDGPATHEAVNALLLELRAGLLEQVTATGKPAWQPLGAHAQAVVAGPIRSVLAVPVFTDREVAGMLVFFLADRSQPDAQLISLLRAITGPVGRMIERTRAERLLQEGEQRYKLLFELSTEAIFVSDLEGHVQSANPAAERLTGFTVAELTAGHTIDLVAPEWRDVIRNQLKRKLAGEAQETRYEAVMLDRAGRRKPVEIASSLIVSMGTIVGVQANIRDVTERQRAELAVRESEQRFRQAFDNAPIGMALVAPNGQWLQVNQALCELVGYTTEELLTRTFQAITHPDDLETDLAYTHQVLTGEIRTYQMQKRYLRKNGDVVWIQLKVSLVRAADGTPAYFISQIQDINEHKLREQAAAEFHARHPTPRALSPREQDVLALLAEGLTTAQTGAELHIGEETIQTHVRHAMTKLNATNRTQAVTIALRLGLLT